MDEPNRVILIGGTSHIGKSTLATALAEDLQWDYLSTDKLARHPGHPWTPFGRELKPHVADHYRELDVDTLVSEVMEHYKRNVAPIIRQKIEERLRDETMPGLVIEGSALLPDLIGEHLSESVRGVCLLADHNLIRKRIYSNSEYLKRGQEEQQLIDKFLWRSIKFDQRLRDQVGTAKIESIEILDAIPVAELVRICVNRMCR